MSENDDLCRSSPRLTEPCFGDQLFPKMLFPSDSQVMRPLSTSSLTSEYKINYPQTMETQMRKLKLSLEPWRELILQSNSVLLWEKQYHASTILAGSTMFFTFLWFWEPTLLTAFALLGFTFTLSDFLLPYILSTIYSAENWTPDKQKQYEEICTNIILYQTKAELLVSSYYRLRVTNRKLYFGITASTLIFLAWLGNIVDNLLLTYIVVTFLLMVPGMQRHGMLNKVWENVSKLFTELVENAKVRVGHKQE